MGTEEIPIKRRLFEILESVDTVKVIGEDQVIESIVIDSRQASPHSFFCAIKGYDQDGHTYIDKAISAKAAAILCSTLPEKITENVTYVQVADTKTGLEQILMAYYEDISSQTSLIGITGTNGKTTVASLLCDLFTVLGYKVGLISTVEIRIGEERRESKLTTPDTVTLHSLLHEMVNAACDYVFMEVSSHAVDQNRIGGLKYTGAVFTNITHDHLDYHKTFKNYINTKKKFFDNLSKTSFALTNIDDTNGEVMTQNTKAQVSHYSLNKMADFKTKIMSSHITGMELDINNDRVHAAIVGRFNAYNLTAAYGVAMLLGVEKEEILIALSRLKAPKGRFEIIGGQNQTKVVVDYAHTPDALLKILKAITELSKTGKIITVVGCGGDRDKEKRPKIARIATEYSDQVILTSDNPRWEDPEAILLDMMGGVADDEDSKVLEIADRKNAIKTAIRMAHTDDIVLIAGKGHENYQEIKGERKPFDDAKIARRILAT